MISAAIFLTAACASAHSEPYFPELDDAASVMRNGIATGETLMFRARSGPAEDIEKPDTLETVRRENASAVKRTGETEAVYEKHSIHKLFRKNPLSAKDEFDPWDISKPEFRENRPAAAAVKYELPTAIENKEFDINKVVNNDNLTVFASAVKTEAALDRRYDNENTALILCCDKGAGKIFDYLLRRNADVNLKNADGTTAVMIAASRGYADMVERLIKMTADVNAADNYGQTALILAARNGNEAICALLLRNGADVNAKNKQGYGAWRYAAERNNLRLTVLLVTNGAEVDAEFEKKMAIKFKDTADMGKTIKPEKTAPKNQYGRPSSSADPQKRQR